MRGIASLSLEQAPPLWAPFLFLLAAPWFGVLAGGLLLGTGQEALADRWQGATLALTHLFTLGVLGLSMAGASLQLLPVLVGVPVPRVRGVALWTWPLLVAGILALVWGFIHGQSDRLLIGACLVATALVPLLVALGVALGRARVANPTLKGMALAYTALVPTLGLGVLLAGMLGGWPGPLDAASLTGLHLSWGLLGWVGLLVTAVAFQVVPLFQMTPEYPPWIRRLLPAGMCAWLILASLWLWLRIPGWPWILAPALAGVGGIAIVTLALQGQRRRRVGDVTLDYWRLGMACVLAALALWPLAVLLGGHWDWWLGVLALLGGAGSLVNGMVLKIVPFLSWFHLQHRQMAHLREQGTLVEIPHMQAFLDPRLGRWQLRLHGLALTMALAAPALPDLLSRVSGGLLILSYGLLGVLLLIAVRRYRRVRKDLA